MLNATSRIAAPRLRLLVAGMLSGLANSAWSAPVSADDHHDERELDAIVVTANPLGGTVEELTEPVAVLAGSQLDDHRSATLGDTVSSIPGVQSSNFGPGVGRPIIRGLDGARVAVLSGGLATQDVSTVSQDHAPAVEPFLADQIEVLKGPATLLYGSGAIGGVVNIVEGRIAETAYATPFSGRAEIRHDSVNQGRTAMARIDGGSETFALHADAVYRRSDDYQVPGRGKQANSFLDTDSGGVGGSLLGDWGFVGFSASTFQDRYGNPGEPGDAAADEPGVFLDIDQKRFELKGALNRIGADDGRLRFSLARTDYEHIEFEGDEIGTRFLKDATEGRVEWAYGALAGWTGVIGLQGSDSEFAAIGEEAFVPRTQTRAAGLFVLQRKRWDRLQLDMGARIDDVESDPDLAARRDFNPLSLSAGMRFELSDAWELLANLDHAERAPAEEELFANGPHIATAAFEIGDPQLDVEAANQAELGLHFHAPTFEAKLSAYYNRFNDFIYLADTGQFGGEGDEALPVRQWSQADARFRGLEAEATLKLANNQSGDWRLRLFGDTVRATLADGKGNVPRIAPGRLGAELRWSRSSWRTALSATHSAEQDELAAGESATDGYTLFDASATYHWDVGAVGWEVFLSGRNLGDEEGRVHTSFLKDVVVLPGRGAALGIRAYF